MKSALRLLFATSVLLVANLQLHAQLYNWTTIAGLAGTTNTTDGVGSDARFRNPYNLAVGNTGNIYVADTFNSLIRKLDLVGTNWTVSTIASGALLQSQGIAVDAAENIYFTGTRVRKLTLVGTNWVISSVAGGSYGSADGTNSAAQFAGPQGVAVDLGGNLYVADTQNSTIRKVTPLGTNWVVSTIAGLAGNTGTNDGVGSAARFNWPTGVAADGTGNLFVADSQNNTIRKLSFVGGNWEVSTIAGLGGSLGGADGTNSSARFSYPSSVAVDTNGVVFVAASVSDTIRTLTAIGTNWVVKTIGGTHGIVGSTDGTNNYARFQNPYGVAVGSGGSIVVADTYNHTIRLGVPIPIGSLQMTLSPAGAVSAGAQWRVDGGAWQNSGATVGDLTLGSHSVTFNTISGWTTPASQNVTINSNQTTTTTGIYVQQFGSVQVTLSPAGAVSAGAQWRVDGGEWQNSGATVSGLTLGSHTVTFNTISGWTTPVSQNVTINFNQTTTPTGNYVQQFGSLQVTLSPAGAMSAGAQWQVDGGAWQYSGTIVGGLTLGNHTVTFKTISGWVTPISQNVTINFNQTTTTNAVYFTPHAATATSIVTNGFVVGATITDAGYGYTNAPAVYLVGGGGSGAQATVTVSNGVVTSITIINAGFGYTNPPIVAITPPFPLLLGIVPVTQFSFTNLLVGTNYYLQVWQSGIWNYQGSPFVAASNTHAEYSAGFANGSSYRLLALPIPYGATASPQLVNGFVVGATVLNGGSGYASVPAVLVIGGGGSGAQAAATVSNGVVTAINISSAGFGYTNTPTIQIDPPPIPALLPNTSQAFRLDYSGLTPALTYQLQASHVMTGWTNFGAAFTATANTNSEYLNFEMGNKFFRVSLP